MITFIEQGASTSKILCSNIIMNISDRKESCTFNIETSLLGLQIMEVANISHEVGSCAIPIMES